MTEPRIFISYARSDGEKFATKLRKRLAAEIDGEQLWQDRARMEGGVGWWQQIAEAIEKVDFMVLLATPKAMDSPIVKKEWRYARQQGVCVYPVQVPGHPIDFDALPRWMRDSHFYNLDKEWETFVNYLKNPCHAAKVPFMAPDLPEHFVQRPAQFDALKTRLLDADFDNPVAITTALKGAGGFGKTTLAAALCHDEDVQAAFDDGVMWVTLGEQPDVVNALTILYRALTDENPGFVNAEDAAVKLAEKLADRDVLLVIDDAWDSAHLRPFLRGGERCARLITTRDAGIAVNVRAAMTDVDEMSGGESVAMLGAGVILTPNPSPQSREGSKSGNLTPSIVQSKEGKNLTPYPSPTGEGSKAEGLDERLRRLAGRLGEWPLMLEIANGQLRERVEIAGDTPSRALDWLERLLDKRGISGVQRDDAETRKRDAAGVLGGTLDLLTPDDRARLCQLAVFKDDADVPLSSIMRLWQVDEFDTEDLILKLAKRSLLRFSSSTATIRLHDVIREYLATQVGDMAALHGRLIEAYALTLSEEQNYAHTLPDDYAWRNIAYHLIGAGQNDRLRELLLDFRWLQAKLDATDGSALIADCEVFADDTTIRLLKSTLSMSLHILIDDKIAMPHQLVGRLMSHRQSNDEILALTETLITLPGIYPANPDGEYPILNQAGGALLRTLSGHTSGLYGAIQLADGSLLSWSYDHTLRLWEADGAALAVLAGHTSVVNGVMQLTDGRLLSWSFDDTLRLWEADGAALAVLAGHTSVVNGVMQLTDGRLLSWADNDPFSDDQDYLRLWDADGVALAVLEGHTNGVSGTMQLADGRLLSWSSDTTLRLWASDGAALAVLEGHTNGVSGAMQLADGRLLSWSSDKTLRLWEANGAALAVLAGHTREVRGAMQLADGRLLSWSSDKTLRLWDVNGAALAAMEGHTSGVSGARQLADGRLLSWAGGFRSRDHTLRLWEANGMALAVMAGHTDRVSGAMQLTDGRLLSWSSDDTLRLWGNDGAAITTLQGHMGKVKGAVALTDGRLLSWADSFISKDHTLRLWEADGTALRVMAGHTSWVSGARQLADGRLLSRSDDTTLRLWEADGRALAVLAGHTDSVSGAMQLADGRLLSWAGGGDFGSKDHTLRLWEADGTVLTVMAGHANGVRGAMQLADGRLLSWSSDHTLRLWEADGAVLAVMVGHTDEVSGAMQLADGRLLSWAGGGVFGSKDHTLRLWDVDGSALVVLVGHTDRVNGAMQLADGRLLSWASDKTLRLWEADGTPLDVLNESYYSGNRKRIYAWARSHGFDADVLYADEVSILDDDYRVYNRDQRLELYRRSDGVTVATFHADAYITCVTTIPEKRLIVAGDRVGRVMFLRWVE